MLPNIQVNRYFAEHPEMVLSEHAIRRGIYGPGMTYTCRPRHDGVDLEILLKEALDRLPADIVSSSLESPADAHKSRMPAPRPRALRSRKGPTCSARRADWCKS